MAEEWKALSDLPEVAKLNGEFRKNYGKLLGAFLYLRSNQRRPGTVVVPDGLAISDLLRSARLARAAGHLVMSLDKRLVAFEVHD